MIIIKENKPYYADKAEEILAYVKANVKDKDYLDVGEAFIADMVGTDEPMIIIPFNNEIKNLDEMDPELAISECEFILFYNPNLDTYSPEYRDKYSLICRSYDGDWDFDIARYTTLETCIDKLNAFMKNPEQSFAEYYLEIV